MGLDGEAVAGLDVDLIVQLPPERRVPMAHGFGRRDLLVHCFRVALVHREVGQPERHVLDEDVEVVGSLAVGERGVDLAGLGIHQVGLDRAAVTPEQGVRERAVAPVHAGTVEVHQQRGHGVEQPLAIAARRQRDAHEEPPVLERVAEVLGYQDRRVLERPDRDPDRANGG